MREEIQELILESYENGDISLTEARVLIEKTNTIGNDGAQENDQNNKKASKAEEKKLKRKKVLKTLGKGALAAGALAGTAAGAYSAGKIKSDNKNAEKIRELKNAFKSANHRKRTYAGNARFYEDLFNTEMDDNKELLSDYEKEIDENKKLRKELHDLKYRV